MTGAWTAGNVINALTAIGLFLLMLATGMRATFRDVLDSLRRPRLVALSLAANFVFVPALAWGLLTLFHADPLIAAGFLILAACPGAPVGPPYAVIARGDVPLAIGQMILLAGLSAILSPALLQFLIGQVLPDSSLQVDYRTIVQTLLIAQVAPLAIGLTWRHRRGDCALRSARRIATVANILLLTVIALLLFREHQTLSNVPFRGWFRMLLLFGGCLAIGWLSGGPGLASRRTLALTTAVRNAAVALVIVTRSFAETSAVTAVISFAIVTILGGLICAMLFSRVASPSSTAPEGAPAG